MNILCLSPRQSWPVTSGAKQRDFYLARALSRMGNLTYVHYRSSPQPLPLGEGFSSFSRVLSVPAPPPYGAVKILQGTFSRWPLPVLNYTSPQLQHLLADLLRAEAFDIIHVDSVHLCAVIEPLRAACGNARIFYNWHNIESELMDRYAETAPTPLHRVYARRTAAALRGAERHILETAHGHIVCSERERRHLLGVNSQARIATVDNGVDTQQIVPIPHSSNGNSRSSLVFVGNMNYHANIDGAVHFARDIWPSIRALNPHLTLTLVGADPAPAVQALATQPGIAVTGTVPEILPYYRDALAAVVPLRTGSGTRLKILEAMAAGVPVISTRIGAEGLDATPDTNILIAQFQDDWLRHLRQLSSAEAWQSLADAGLHLARSRYDWTALGERMASVYRSWLM